MNITHLFLYFTGTVSILFSLYLYITLFSHCKKNKDSIPIKSHNFRDRPSFLSRLKNHATKPLHKLWNLLDEESRETIGRMDPHKNEVDEPQWEKIVGRLNFIMADYYFYDEDSFRDIEPDDSMKDLIEAGMESLKPDEVKLFNRLLLEKICPELQKCQIKTDLLNIERVSAERLLSGIISLIVVLIGIVSFIANIEVLFGFFRLFSVFSPAEVMKNTDITTVIFNYIKYLIFTGGLFYTQFSLIFWGGFALLSPAKLMRLILKRQAQFLFLIAFCLTTQGIVLFYAPMFYVIIGDIINTISRSFR